LQFIWLHSANYWFGFDGFNGTYRNCGKTVYSLLTFDAIRSAYALAKYYTGSFTSIDISDSLHWYDLYDFGDGGLNFNLAKLCHFTARSVFEYIRVGAHYASQRDILRGDFWETLYLWTFRKVEQIWYTILQWLIVLLFEPRQSLSCGLRYAISVSVLLISTYEGPQNMRVRELILENHDTLKWQLTLMDVNWPIQN
jgi:hypothetical protein